MCECRKERLSEMSLLMTLTICVQSLGLTMSRFANGDVISDRGTWWKSGIPPDLGTQKIGQREIRRERMERERERER